MQRVRCEVNFAKWHKTGDECKGGEGGRQAHLMRPRFPVVGASAALPDRNGFRLVKGCLCLVSTLSCFVKG